MFHQLVCAKKHDKANTTFLDVDLFMHVELFNICIIVLSVHSYIRSNYSYSLENIPSLPVFYFKKPTQWVPFYCSQTAAHLLDTCLLYIHQYCSMYEAFVWSMYHTYTDVLFSFWLFSFSPLDVFFLFIFFSQSDHFTHPWKCGLHQTIGAYLPDKVHICRI